MTYFVDTGEGVEYYDTEAEAKKSAEDWIDEYRTNGDGEWDTAVERICWGVVREYACPMVHAVEGYVDYKLEKSK